LLFSGRQLPLPYCPPEGFLSGRAYNDGIAAVLIIIKASLLGSALMLFGELCQLHRIVLRQRGAQDGETIAGRLNSSTRLQESITIAHSQWEGCC
jgi:hypothetical protein